MNSSSRTRRTRAVACCLLLLAITPARAADFKPGDSFKDCPDCPVMVVVSSGKLTMGSPPTEEGRFANEGPQREVTVTHAFAVGKCKVTVEEFSRFVADSGYRAKETCHYWTGVRWRSTSKYSWEWPGFWQGPTEPVVCVTWNDAKAFTAWLSAKTGSGYRLLSESEWEYAARAGTTTARPWGSELSRDKANYGADECCQPFGEGRNQFSNTVPVGTFPPNRFGLYEMLGNVWEWVEDCWNETYAGAPTDASAWHGGDCRKRVIRGASWYSDPRRVRSAVRYAFDQDVNRTKVGFRVARGM